MKNFYDAPLKIKHVIFLIFIIFVITVIILLIKFQPSPGEIIIAFSTLIAPLAALQIQSFIEKIRMKEAKRMDIFKVLMATRATPLNFEHVKAINMINIEFYGDTEVINAWKEYLDIRCRQDLTNVGKEYADSLVNLLQKMASSLGLNFYDGEIREGAYRPKAHVDIEELQLRIYLKLDSALNNGKFNVINEASDVKTGNDKQEMPEA